MQVGGAHPAKTNRVNVTLRTLNTSLSVGNLRGGIVNKTITPRTNQGSSIMPSESD